MQPQAVRPGKGVYGSQTGWPKSVHVWHEPGGMDALRERFAPPPAPEPEPVVEELVVEEKPPPVPFGLEPSAPTVAEETPKPVFDPFTSASPAVEETAKPVFDPFAAPPPADDTPAEKPVYSFGFDPNAPSGSEKDKSDAKDKPDETDAPTAKETYSFGFDPSTPSGSSTRPVPVLPSIELSTPSAPEPKGRGKKVKPEKAVKAKPEKVAKVRAPKEESDGFPIGFALGFLLLAAVLGVAGYHIYLAVLVENFMLVGVAAAALVAGLVFGNSYRTTEPESRMPMLGFALVFGFVAFYFALQGTVV